MDIAVRRLQKRSPRRTGRASTVAPLRAPAARPIPRPDGIRLLDSLFARRSGIAGEVSGAGRRGRRPRRRRCRAFPASARDRCPAWGRPPGSMGGRGLPLPGLQDGGRTDPALRESGRRGPAGIPDLTRTPARRRSDDQDQPENAPADNPESRRGPDNSDPARRRDGDGRQPAACRGDQSRTRRGADRRCIPSAGNNHPRPRERRSPTPSTRRRLAPATSASSPIATRLPSARVRRFSTARFNASPP